MPSRQLEKSLKAFLAESTIAYAEGEVGETEIVTGEHQGVYKTRNWRIEDSYHVSPDKRIYSGQEVVTRRGDVLWKSVYHGEVVPDTDPELALSVYAQALKQPAPELPIRGPRRLQIGDMLYTLDSLRGPLSVARFAVTDQIRQNGSRIYDGHIAGGWIVK
jgi:hypothetical protein